MPGCSRARRARDGRWRPGRSPPRCSVRRAPAAVTAATAAPCCAHTHADVRSVVPEGLSISVNEMRAVVQLAARSPATGRWQVVLIEDADRLTEGASNALLKAVEEPRAAHGVPALRAVDPPGRRVGDDPVALPGRGPAHAAQRRRSPRCWPAGTASTRRPPSGPQRCCAGPRRPGPPARPRRGGARAAPRMLAVPAALDLGDVLHAAAELLSPPRARPASMSEAGTRPSWTS